MIHKRAILEEPHTTYANHAIVEKSAGMIAYTPWGKHRQLLLVGADSTAEAGMVKFSEEVAAVLTSLFVGSSLFSETNSGDGVSVSVILKRSLFWLSALILVSSVVMMSRSSFFVRQIGRRRVG